MYALGPLTLDDDIPSTLKIYKLFVNFHIKIITIIDLRL